MLGLVCAATFMLLLDLTIVSVALPSIQRQLHANLSDLQWVSEAYALVLAVLLLPAATLGDRMGRRRLFLTGLAIFTAGSLACALAPTILALELSRAFQGAGGAVLFATGTPLLRQEFSGRSRSACQGLPSDTEVHLSHPISSRKGGRPCLTSLSGNRSSQPGKQQHAWTVPVGP
jgi:MFS family permease